MKTYPPLARGSRSSWIAAGIFLIFAGMAMIPFNVVTALGIGLIVGGISTIVGAYMRSSSSS